MLTHGKSRWYSVFCVLSLVVPLTVYLASLLPGVGFWDTAEMQTVPYIFGVAHPPGFPAFVIIGYLFSHLFVFGNVAWRLSLMSAVAVAGAAWLIFKTLYEEGVNPLLASLCTCTFALGTVVWTRATRAEVHALALFFIAAAIWAALRARRSGRPSALYLCGASLGLAAATHPVMVWILPGIAVLGAPALCKLWRWKPQAQGKAARMTAITFALMIAPLLLYLYMPLRSAAVTMQHLDPTMAVGVPPGQPFWDYGHTADLHRFILQLTGAQFPKGNALRALLQPGEYPTFALTFFGKALDELGAPMLFLAVAAVIRLLFSDRLTLIALSLIVLLGVPFALSYGVEIDPDRYLLTAYWGIAILAGIGAQGILALTKTRLQNRIALALLAIVLLESVIYDFQVNAYVWQQRSDRSAEQFVDRVIQKTPPGSIIVSPWVYATTLAYAGYVEHRLNGRIVETAQPFAPPLPLIVQARKRPLFVLYFETTPRSIAGVRQALVDRTGAGLYRIIPRR
ncbi:MAG: DUF2723 domain-containing protein [Acidobacteriaceae bacterium]|nr:DUF2723 domain-containing protein [Acidobacteriaceae bacterium]